MMRPSESCFETLNRIRTLEEKLTASLGAEQAQMHAAPLIEAFIHDMRQAALSQAEVERTFLTKMIEKDPATARFMRQSIYHALLAIATSVDSFESEGHTSAHLQRIGAYAGLLAQRHIECHQSQYPRYDPLGYGHDVALVAPLHDIGKRCLPRELVNSSKKYGATDTEREIMKVHVDCGAIMLTIPGHDRGKENHISLALHVIRGHHWPEYGPGNPTRSLAADIVKVVDVFDAGTSVRPYKPAFPFDKVVKEWIMDHRGAKFNADVADTFYLYKDEFRQLHDQFKA